MTYDEALDLAVDLVCSMQLETARTFVAEVGGQLDGDSWYALLGALVDHLDGRTGPAPVLAAEAALHARTRSILSEANRSGPRLRRLTQAAASTLRRVEGWARFVQPTVLHGPGRLVLGEGAQLGWPASSGYASGVGYIECRDAAATVRIGDRTVINNNVSLVAEGPVGIDIGADCLLGVDVTIGDSDGHGVAPDRRHGFRGLDAPVVVEDNVWLGTGVLVLKGVTIGRDCVVGARSLVNRSLPAGSIAVGVPARVVGDVRDHVAPRD